MSNEERMTKMAVEKTMEKIVSLSKSRGFVFPGSEVYGGLANTWDYGPLGVELKNNVKKAWWKKFVQESPYNVGLDAAILMNPQTWVASGHVGGFSDPLIDCKKCKSRFRADKIIEDFIKENKGEEINVDGWDNEKLEGFIQENHMVCPECGEFDYTGIRKFNLMFKTFQGVTEDSTAEIFLRPETAQGIFVNFKKFQKKLDFFFCFRYNVTYYLLERSFYGLQFSKYKIKDKKNYSITCNDDNIASERSIISCGGKLEDIRTVDGKNYKRFWIEL